MRGVLGQCRDKLRLDVSLTGRKGQLTITDHHMMKRTLFVLLASLTSLHAAAATPSDVEMLPSGVRVEHLVRGTGTQPSASSTVLVHYHGTLGNGKVFDSSIERDAPLSFPLSGVIPCWTQGVQRMRVGGKANLTCPSRTAYGEAGAGRAVPPNATLKFEVHLLEVQ